MTDSYDRIAPYYDLVTGAFDADIALYTSYARRLNAPVLELGAGTGRLMVPLARQGLVVFGIDASAAMLERARARAADAAVTLHLTRGDFCRYRFDERFSLIYCAVDSFLHLAEPERQLSALRRAGEHLADDGRLLLDLPALGGGHWHEWEPGVRPLELLWSGEGPNGRPLQYFVTFTADPASQRRHVIHIFDELDDDGTVRRTIAEYDLRFIFPGELPLLVQAAGLWLYDVYGGYDLEPFTSGCERMIAVIGRA